MGTGGAEAPRAWRSDIESEVHTMQALGVQSIWGLRCARLAPQGTTGIIDLLVVYERRYTLRIISISPRNASFPGMWSMVGGQSLIPPLTWGCLTRRVCPFVVTERMFSHETGIQCSRRCIFSHGKGSCHKHRVALWFGLNFVCSTAQVCMHGQR